MEIGEKIDKRAISSMENECRIQGLRIKEIREGITDNLKHLRSLIRNLRDKRISAPTNEKKDEYDSNIQEFLKLKKYYLNILRQGSSLQRRTTARRNKFRRILRGRKTYDAQTITMLQKYDDSDVKTYIENYYQKFVKRSDSDGQS